MAVVWRVSTAGAGWDWPLVDGARRGRGGDRPAQRGGSGLWVRQRK